MTKRSQARKRELYGVDSDGHTSSSVTIPANTAPPTQIGPGKVANLQTVNPGTWTGSYARVSYQWRINGYSYHWRDCRRLHAAGVRRDEDVDVPGRRQQRGGFVVGDNGGRGGGPVSKKKVHEDTPLEPDDTIEVVEPETAPGKFGVVVEDYEADAPAGEVFRAPSSATSNAPGPVIETGSAHEAESDNEFGVDLSHLTPTARERTLAEMRGGAEKVGNVPKQK